MQDLKNIIESLLFVAEEPLTVDKLKRVLETADGNEIRSTLQDLSQEYEARGGGFRLCEVAGGFQLRSRSEYHEWIKRMLQPSPQRLSKAALETLAVVAYRQPVIRSDIEHIRGVDCGGVLRQLMERKLIRVLGRKEIPGRPLIYATTKLFLELFDLKDLKDLPTPLEMEQLGNLPDQDQQKPPAMGDPQGVNLTQTAEGASAEADTAEDASQEAVADDEIQTAEESVANTDGQLNPSLSSSSRNTQADVKDGPTMAAVPDDSPSPENEPSQIGGPVIEESAVAPHIQESPDDLKNT